MARMLIDRSHGWIDVEAVTQGDTGVLLRASLPSAHCEVFLNLDEFDRLLDQFGRTLADLREAE